MTRRDSRLLAPLAALGLFAAGAAAAADGVKIIAVPDPEATTNFTLSGIVMLALRESPDLRSFRARREDSQERTARERALPNPMFNFAGMMDRPRETTWPESRERQLGLQQEFPGFGKRELRVGIASQDAAMAGYDLEVAARQVVMTLKEAYFDLISIQRVRAAARQDGDVLERLENLARARDATGGTAPRETTQAQAAMTQFRKQMADLEAREKTLKARLNALTNRRADAPLELAASVPQIPETGGVEGLLALASANRPELRAAEARVRRDELNRQLKGRESVPDYKLGLQYRRNSDNTEGVLFTLGFGLPLWHRTNEVGVREAERLVAASRAEQKETEQAIAQEVRAAYDRVQAARKTFDHCQRELVPQAGARFQASEARYQSGQTGFSELLESQRVFLDARVLEIMAEGDVGAQFARLERAVGVEMLK